MRYINTLAVAAALSIATFAVPAYADEHYGQCTVIRQADGSGYSPDCDQAHLNAAMQQQASQQAQGPTWQQAQAPAPYHDQVVRANYQHTCEPTRSGGQTCYGREPGPNALQVFDHLAYGTAEVVRAFRRW